MGKKYTRSLAAICEEHAPLEFAGYNKRDMIGSLPSGEWIAFLDCGYTHGPVMSREAALKCCQGECECWKERKKSEDRLKKILQEDDSDR